MWLARVEPDIAPVNNVQAITGIEVPCMRGRSSQRSRCGANSARAEASAGAIGGGKIERYADNGDVNASKVLL